jgi:AcrR family transcriptional regulator
MPRRRNKEETMQLLIAAVGEILKEKGYAGLGLNKIALRAGVTKELIYRYFDGLNNLLKTYINGKDYWMPLLEQLNNTEVGSEEELLQLFIGLLQEQFKFFFAEQEMQKFILWQISEVNSLMRSISERREIQGAKLLALTDEHFRGSGISFKAVTALLLGGIYYVVLHGRSNKSTVAGLDMNHEKDREQILKAVAQIMTWAWEAAEKKRDL